MFLKTGLQIIEFKVVQNGIVPFDECFDPRVLAKFNTASIRPRNLLAVSVLEYQIGSIAFSTSALSMAHTGTFPITGNAYCFSVDMNCAECLAFFHFGEWKL
jgi:hypothetical protein